MINLCVSLFVSCTSYIPSTTTFYSLVLVDSRPYDEVQPCAQLKSMFSPQQQLMMLMMTMMMRVYNGYACVPYGILTTEFLMVLVWSFFVFFVTDRKQSNNSSAIMTLLVFSANIIQIQKAARENHKCTEL